MPAITITDLNNAKLDVDHIAEIATSLADTSTDRLGHTKNTISHAIELIDAEVLAVSDRADQALSVDIPSAIASLTAMNNRGAWVTATAYTYQDIVSSSGSWYICVVPHTSSAVFDTDVATKWRIYQGVTVGDLSTASGSGLVGYSQDSIYTGGSVGKKLQEAISVKDFGAHTTNEPGYSTFDSTAAIQAAIEAVEALPDSSQGKPRIYFPGGTYLITSTIRVKGNFICLYGDGHRATLLYKSGDFGDLLVFEAEDSSTTSIAACSVEGMALRAFSDTTSGALLRLTRTIESSFSDLSFRDNYGGILVEGGIQLRFHNIEIRAGGLWSGIKSNSYMMKFKEGPAAQQKNPSEIFITNLNARNTGTSEQPWVEYGIHISCCDGIWISNGHTLACSLAGLFCEPAVTALSPSGTQLSGIIINNFWFDGHCKFGVTFRGTSPVYGGFIFNNTFFLNAHEYNFHVNTGCTASDFVFTGGECLKAGYSGMYLYGGDNIIVNGMNITGNGVLGTTGRAGVEVGSGVSNVLITGCRIGGTWLGTPTTQTSGVYINSTTSDNINVSNNIFSGHSSANIRDTTSGKMKVYSDNVDDISYSGITASSGSLQIPMTGDYFEVDSGVTAITNMISRNKKRRVTLLFTGACTVSNITNQLELNGSTNLVAKDKDTLSLIYTGTKWTEVSRSIK